VTTEERVGRLLKKKGLKVAIAESCTGGQIADRVTNIPGSSDYFDLGLVTYSNDAKERFLSVPHGILERKGAVSNEVAMYMAEGVKKTAAADIGLSVTGIAGPSGGRPDKPVGTVYIAISGSGETIVRKFLFTGNRLDIKSATSEEALKLLLAHLKGI
jgi:PncC family amidohydrolase